MSILSIVGVMMALIKPDFTTNPLRVESERDY
jgi:hypothetical protein